MRAWNPVFNLNYYVGVGVARGAVTHKIASTLEDAVGVTWEDKCEANPGWLCGGPILLYDLRPVLMLRSLRVILKAMTMITAVSDNMGFLLFGFGSGFKFRVI